REDQGTAARQLPAHLGVWLPPQEAHAWTGNTPQSLLVASGADDAEREIEQREGSHGQINPLVRHQPRDDKEVALLTRGDEETTCLGGGRDEGGLARVVLGDARDPPRRVGDEVVDPRRRYIVPLPQSVDKWGQHRAGQPPQLLALDIVLVAPG